MITSYFISQNYRIRSWPPIQIVLDDNESYLKIIEFSLDHLFMEAVYQIENIFQAMHILAFSVKINLDNRKLVAKYNPLAPNSA